MTIRTSCLPLPINWYLHPSFFPLLLSSDAWSGILVSAFVFTARAYDDCNTRLTLKQQQRCNTTFISTESVNPRYSATSTFLHKAPSPPTPTTPTITSTPLYLILYYQPNADSPDPCSDNTTMLALPGAHYADPLHIPPCPLLLSFTRLLVHLSRVDHGAYIFLLLAFCRLAYFLRLLHSLLQVLPIQR
jgi:hypothetical protein